MRSGTGRPPRTTRRAAICSSWTGTFAGAGRSRSAVATSAWTRRTMRRPMTRTTTGRRGARRSEHGRAHPGGKTMARSRWSCISLFAVTWLVLPLTTAWSASPPPGVGYNPGDMPPTWSQADQNNRPVTFSDFRGQSVILVFSAAWCGPCQDAVPVSDWLVRFLNQKGESTALVEVLVENQFGDPAERIDAQDWADAYGI